MCILIYHENGGRFNASFQEDRASIRSQANQKSAGYHCFWQYSSIITMEDTPELRLGVRCVLLQLFEHNEKAYRAAVQMMEECGKAAIVHPTGTGKSYIAFKLIEEHPADTIFWLSPSEYIFKTQIENAHTHYAEHLDIVRDIISQDYPAYLNSFDKILNHTYGYMFNMMIMKKELLNDYCTWLFDILFKAGQKINAGKENAFQGRFYGRISEIIFNVWLDEQVQSGKIKKKEVKEIPCIHMEKINWYKKGSSFLKAKFLGKKYEGSF